MAFYSAKHGLVQLEELEKGRTGPLRDPGHHPNTQYLQKPYEVALEENIFKMADIIQELSGSVKSWKNGKHQN